MAINNLRCVDAAMQHRRAQTHRRIFHGLPPDKPESWIDNAFYKVFDLKKEALDDPGNRSEAGESAAGLKAIHKTARDALAKQLQHHHLESSFLGFKR